MSTWASVKLADGNVVKGGIGYGFGTANYAKTGPDGVNRELVETCKAAIKAGYRHIDGAEVYANEKSQGVAMKECGVPRDELFITSKVSRKESAKDIQATLKKQLDELQTDYVDLYLLHSPLIGDISEVWQQMEGVKKAGLARSIGVSNYRVRHLKELLASCKEKPVVNQLEIHPYVMGDTQEVLDFCLANDIKPQAYSPSAPVHKFADGPVDEVTARVAGELSTASGKEVNPGQVLLKWAHAKGAIVITTSTKPSRMKEQLEAGGLPELTESQVQAIHDAGIQGGVKRIYMADTV